MQPPVRASSRRHPQSGKPTVQEKAKMIDLEPEEEAEEIPMDDEDIVVEMKATEIEGSNPISKLPKYIPPCRDKRKVPKDINEIKFTMHTPLLSDQIVFEGLCLGRVPLLKLEGWDLADTEHFPHLAIDQIMHVSSTKILE